MELRIAATWRGDPIPEDEVVRLHLRRDGDLRLRADAPWFGDPPPDAPPGPTPNLWAYEVVELFVLGADDRYLEIELGPHGHHLVLRLRGRRRVVERGLPLDFACRRSSGRWVGEARIPEGWLPPGPHRLNAHAIHGVGEARRYLSWTPTGGPAPDFHRLRWFPPVVLP